MKHSVSLMLVCYSFAQFMFLKVGFQLLCLSGLVMHRLCIRERERSSALSALIEHFECFWRCYSLCYSKETWLVQNTTTASNHYSVNTSQGNSKVWEYFRKFNTIHCKAKGRIFNHSRVLTFININYPKGYV